jgi:DNA ligase 1
MRFSDFAKYLQQLENTPSRNEMTLILANMFKQASPADAKMIAYLSQGMLGPAYNNPDTGVADKQLIKAIKRLSEQDVEKLFKEIGDLGLVVEKICDAKESNLTIEEVFEKLIEVSHASGGGSQEKKLQLIGDLISAADSTSAKYIVRILLHKMRIGFSGMTILDSLSWMLVESKKLKPLIESVYNVRADLGEVAKLVKENPDVTRLSVEPIIGVPILMAKGERATTAGQIWERNGECAVEYKLDGLRIQAHIKDGTVKLFSRGLEEVSNMYPDVVEGLRAQITSNAIVEGEMIAVDKNGHFLPFQETVQRKRKYDIFEMMKKVPLKIYLFDVLAVDGKPLIQEPNQRRWDVLTKITKPGECVELITRILAHSEAEIEKFYQRAIADGTEGIFAKKLTGPYQAGGRDFNWIKYKKSYSKSALADTIDAVVMGYDAGQGKRSGFGIGDFLIGVYDKSDDLYKTIAKIGTGLTDDEWKTLLAKLKSQATSLKPQNYDVAKAMVCDYWVKPEHVVEIHADEITKSPMHTSGLALRFPRFVGWREKPPEDATTIIEIEKMFKLQQKGGDN